MVSSIVPGATPGANALSIEPRTPRTNGNGAAATDGGERAFKGDAVEIGAGAQWASVRESVSAGIAQIERALKAGQQALGLAAKVRDAAAANDQDSVDTLIEQLDETIKSAVEDGAKLLANEDLNVQAEPNAPPIRVAGFDASLGGDVVSIKSGATADANLLNAADASIAALQTALTRLSGAARTLSAHQTFLGAAANAVEGVRGDLDADGARLLALQVRQGLDAAGAGIANADPQAVLSLFRA